jgi:topoisomerase IV subunit A
VDNGLRKYVRVPGEETPKGDKRITLLRDISEDDLVRLTEIKIKRISKFNSFKADEQIKKLEEELLEIQHHLDHLIAYAIAYFEQLLEKYSKGKERRTKIMAFDAIQAAEVVANNAKLYVNREEGFIGTGLKKDEFVTDCSDIDDIIVFRKDGKFQVCRIADKVFVGKDILHVDVWKKGDDRTTYNMVYSDGGTGRTFAKRFNVQSITRDREYDLTTGEKNSKLLYFTANPNGEAETVTVHLTQGSRARIKVFDYDFSELDIKGRGSKGNTVTKYPVRKVSLKEAGKSTLSAIKVWMDEVSGRLNTDERGRLIGSFDTGDSFFAIYKDGSYEVFDLDLNKKIVADELMHIGKFDPEDVVSAVYYDGERGWSLVKRFQVETSKANQRFSFITEHKKSKLLFATTDPNATIAYQIKEGSQKVDQEQSLPDFIDVKGWRAIGNKLSDQRLLSVKPVEREQVEPRAKPKAPSDDKLKPGDSIDLDVESNGQTKMFD